jgi:transposase
MGRPRTKLNQFGDAEEVARLLKEHPAGPMRERLIAVKLGLEGELGMEKIGEIVGHPRSLIQCWFNLFRDGGTQRLLEVRRGNGPESLLSPQVATALREELAKGTWRRAEDGQRWLEKEHGLKVAMRTVYKYLGKCAARLKVPRPTHEKKDAQAAETFKNELAKKLDELKVEPAMPVRVWVADEMRYGLQPVTRRVWTLRGTRIVVPVNPTFKWGYVYGALQVGGGGSEFFYCPTVNLECSELFLKQLSQRDPGAIHVVIWDGAGFHQKDTQMSVPENVRLIQLPAYSPELNPIEKLWDIVKDGICNRLYPTISDLESDITKVLAGYWNDSRKVFSLIGRGWILDQVNAISPDVIPL